MSFTVSLAATCLVVVAAAGCSGNGSSQADPSRSAVATRSSAAEPTAAPPTRAEATRQPPSVEVTVAASAEATQQTTSVSTAPVPMPEATSSDDSSTWGWVALVAVLAAGFGLFAFMGSGRRRGRWETWCRSTRPDVDAARGSRDLLPTSGRDITDVARWGEVRAQVEQSERGLRTAATTAPKPEAAAAASQGAEALSGVVLALESARLLGTAQPPPTAGQVVAADSASQDRRAELDAALDRLDRMLSPAAATTS